MSTALLLLALAAPLQDPVAPVPAQDAPAAPAAPAVTATPDNVRAFLSDAQLGLYDPQAAGLTSLAFDVPIDIPQLGMGEIGVVHVIWTKGLEAQATYTPKSNLTLPAQVPAAMVEAQSLAQGRQFLGSMLNQTISSLLEAGVATMAGVKDGMVAIHHMPPDAADAGIKEMTYYFDEDSRLQKSTALIEQQGPMGAMTVNMHQVYLWKPAFDGSDLLIVDSQTVELAVGPMKQSSSASYGYTRVGEIVLPIELKTSMQTPRGNTDQVIAAKNLVVNGKPVELPAAVPAAAPAPAPEAPRDASGG